MNHIEKNRDFKGIWIPKEIWLAEELTLQEKVFLSEIDSLDNDKGCFASNAYFAEFFGMSETRISQIINSLIQKELIFQENFDGRKRILRSCLKEKFKAALNFSKGSSKEKFKDIAKYNNKVNNSISKDILKGSEEPIKDKPPQAGECPKSKSSKSTTKIEPKNKKDSIVEFWNNFPLTRSHGNPDSKVYRQAVVQFQRLRSGVFAQYNSLKLDINYTDRKWTEQEIKQAMSSLQLLFKNGFWPINKDILPKDLPSLIFNPRTGMSWLIQATIKPPQPIYKTKTIKPKHPEIFEMYRGIFNGQIKTKEDENNFVSVFNSFYTEITKQVKEVGAYMRHTSFSSHIGSEKNPKPFFRQHVDWLKKLSKINLFVIKTGNNYYNSYIAHLKSLHGFDLYPDAKQEQHLRAQFEREMRR